MLDKQRFLHAWLRCADKMPDVSVFDMLAANYSGPERFYHSQEHLLDCLRQLDEVRHLADHNAEVELALWFHDAVYDSHAKDNEQQSAAWAVSALQQVEAPLDCIQRIEAIILATRHASDPVTQDEKLAIDIDLSILGADPVRIAEYDYQIRQEYAWVPEEQYRIGRMTILEQFLQRPSIYFTQHFREKYEATARDNLKSVINRLRHAVG